MTDVASDKGNAGVEADSGLHGVANVDRSAFGAQRPQESPGPNGG